MKKTVESVCNEFIGITEKVEDGIHRCCNKEVSKLIQYGEENEWNWTNLEENVVEQGVERSDGSKIVPYSPFVPSSHKTYFTPSETEAKLILKELALNRLGVKPWLK